MKNTFYIKIDAIKPPEDDDDYITDHGQLQYSPDDEVWQAKIDDYWETFNPKWYLQEISLSDIMIEFAAWKDRTYYKCDLNSYTPVYVPNIIKGKKFTYEELAEIFITQKGIVIK